MISRKVGISLKENMRPRSWWLKLGIAIILSNIFFFILFSKNESHEQTNSLPTGTVEIQIKAQSLTPFQSEKKVLLVHRNGRKQIPAVLKAPPLDLEGRFTVLVKEEEAQVLLNHENWEILPFIKSLTFVAIEQGVNHEIHY